MAGWGVIARSALQNQLTAKIYLLIHQNSRAPFMAVVPPKVSTQRSGINGSLISWFLFPKSKYKWVAGKKVPGKPCPTVILKAD